MSSESLPGDKDPLLGDHDTEYGVVQSSYSIFMFSSIFALLGFMVSYKLLISSYSGTDLVANHEDLVRYVSVVDSYDLTSNSTWFDR